MTKKGSKRKYQFEQVNLRPHVPEFENILCDVNIARTKELT